MSIEAPINLNKKRQELRGVTIPEPQFTAEEAVASINEIVVNHGRRLTAGSEYSEELAKQITPKDNPEYLAERSMDMDFLGQQAAAKRIAEAEGQQTYPQIIAELNNQEEDSSTELYDVKAEYAKIIAAKSKRDRNRNIKLAVIGLIAALTVLKTCDIPNPIPKPTPRPQPTFLTDKNSGSTPVIDISLHNK